MVDDDDDSNGRCMAKWSNNCAVVALERGDLESAVQSLRVALTCSKDTLPKSSSEAEHPHPCRKQQEHAPPGPTDVRMTMVGMERATDHHDGIAGVAAAVQNTNSTSPNTSLRIATTTACFKNDASNLTHLSGVYTQAVKFESLQPDKISCMETSTAIMMYNFALTNHMRAIQNVNSHNSSDLLRKARHIYTLCATLICQITEESSSSSVQQGLYYQEDSATHESTYDDNNEDATIELLTMAILNNMACIEVCLCNAAESTRCLSELIGFATTLPYHDGEQSAFFNNHKEFFLRNATTLLNQAATAPSAAAA